MSAQQDYFGVELKTAAGDVLASIDYDGARWYVGEPGQEFVVSVTSSIQSGATYKVFLKVDGQDPGYCKIFQDGQATNAVFQGWLGRSAGGTVSYNLFKFGSCKPSQAAATVSNPDDIPASHIQVSFTKVQATDQTMPAGAVFRGAGPSDAAASKTLAEGKQWFLAPGLKTEAGSTVVQARGWTNTVYRTIGYLPSLSVRYDSSEALYLRKALNPRFGPHRAILRRSANPAIAALGAEPEPENPPPPPPAAAAAAAAAAKPTAGAAGRAVSDSRKKLTGAAGGASSPRGDIKQQQDATARMKREAAGVKREREDGQGEEEYVPRSATAADRVDLTEEPVRPMTVNGRQLAPDELAMCDLCDSDDEGGADNKWQVKKKHQIKVEL